MTHTLECRLGGGLRRGRGTRSTCCTTEGAVEDGEVAKLLALESIALLRNWHKKQLDSFLGADEGAGGVNVVDGVGDLNYNVEGFSENMFPAWFSPHISLFVLPD